MVATRKTGDLSRVARQQFQPDVRSVAMLDIQGIAAR
jgi:hypothetical protein